MNWLAGFTFLGAFFEAAALLSGIYLLGGWLMDEPVNRRWVACWVFLFSVVVAGFCISVTGWR